MAISAHIDEVTGLRSHTVTGSVDAAEIRAEIARVFADPAFDPEAPTLWDFRGVEKWNIGLEDVRGLAINFAEHWGRTASGRVAILVGRDLQFGQVRQFLALGGGETRREVELFRDHEEALAWLLDSGAGRN